MKILKMNEMLKTNWFMKGIYAVNIIPKKRTLTHTYRKLNGFLYMLEGNIEYSFGGNTVQLSPGSLIYLPRSSAHTYRAISEKVRYMRIDFELYDASDGEQIIFSGGPVLITNELDYEAAELLHELCDLFLGAGYASALRANSLLAMFLYRLIYAEHTRQITSGKKNVLLLAMDEIKQNYASAVSTESLAEKFGISPSHLRRLFRKATGGSVTDYVHRTRISASLYLLRDSEMSILDIALMVGFDGQNYFTRIFKRQLGMTPGEYRHKNHI